MTREHSGPREVGQGLVGAVQAAFNLATPFLRGARSRSGLALEEARRAYPGDELVAEPSWQWTHAVDVDTRAGQVWPWLVQIGQDKAGFYSHEWLENLAGCKIRNGEYIQQRWQALQVGDALKLHPKVPPLTVAAIHPGRWFVVTNGSDALTEGAENVAISWLFLIEPLSEKTCRVISHYRIRHPKGWRARLTYGPWLTEAIGFVMDRAMLIGIKRRAEGKLSRAGLRES